MKIVTYKWLPVLIALTLVSALLLGCVGDRQSQDARSVEIREYQGQKLDSIAKFEENSIQGPPRLDINRYALRVSGLVEKPLSYSYQEVLARTPVSKVTVIHCVEGWDVKILWEGVPIPDLLRAAGVKPTAKTVIFKSADGYSTSLPLETVIKKNILLAFRMNGLTLPAERGFPFQVVAEDKWGYKWAKWVTEMELSDNPNFKGYWESRGYNTKGDHSGPIFEERR